MSHRLRCMQRTDGMPVLVLEAELQTFQLDDQLPSPAEQVDRLILWIGSNQFSPGRFTEFSTPKISAWVGAPITPSNGASDVQWLTHQDEVKRLLEFSGPFSTRLTLAGWKRFEDIRHAQVESRTAFMAMKFGDEDLNCAVDTCFKPAVARAGFELRLLSDGQPAGLIDDQLRVRLRTSRFVIADLTHANNGAYWEAGFAEGLGRPVIYTCRQREWDELDEQGRRKVHFDTNHLVTIIWDPTKLEDAATRLTATIRATLPGEAKMTDSKAA
ncbi:MAG: hypothetical protein ACLPIG_02035 [Methylocella sp.]